MDIIRVVMVRDTGTNMATTGTITVGTGTLSHGGLARPLWRHHTMPIHITMMQNPSMQVATTFSGVWTGTVHTTRGQIRSGDMTAWITAASVRTTTELGAPAFLRVRRSWHSEAGSCFGGFLLFGHTTSARFELLGYQHYLRTPFGALRPDGEYTVAGRQRLARRQPAARASCSEQNQRSPFDVVMRVSS
jgi:hypothetical protein